jgi:hypothetical protein
MIAYVDLDSGELIIEINPGDRVTEFVVYNGPSTLILKGKATQEEINELIVKTMDKNLNKQFTS